MDGHGLVCRDRQQALTPVLIIVPYAIIHKQKISVKEVIGTLITMVGVALFFLL